MTLFQLGEVQISSKAGDALSESGQNVSLLLSSHQSGDWGDVSASVAAENEFALEYGQSTHQISSQYRLDSGLVLVVTTSSDRTLTLIQLLSEHIVRDADAVEGYATWAQTYDLEVNPLIAAEEPRVQRIFNEVPMNTAIDIGTGTGRHAIVLAKRGVAVTAVDQSPEMLSVARQKAAREGLEIDFRIGSLDDRLPSEDEHFDFLVCALALSHVPDIGHAVRECARVVKEGGVKGTAMMDHRGGEKLYHLAPLLSINVSANCEGKMSPSVLIGLRSQFDFRKMPRLLCRSA